MKTTLEIPDAIFRQAKAKAAERGIPLRQLVTEAVEQNLRSTPNQNNELLLKQAGKLRHLKKETARINKLIEAEFGQIDPEDWT